VSMVDTERRDQILRAEAAIRQLAEQMAENLAGRRSAEQEASAFQRGCDSLAEANRALCASSKAADNAQKALADTQAEWLRSVTEVGRVSIEGAEEIRRCCRLAVSDLHESKVRFDASVNNIQAGMQAGNETFHKAVSILLDGMTVRQKDFEQHGQKQIAIFDAGQELLASLGRTWTERGEEMRGCGQKVISDLLEADSNLKATVAEIRAGNEAFSLTCETLMNNLATQRQDLEEDSRKRAATLEAGQALLARRFTIGGLVFAALLIANLVVLVVR
jgi:hypothetical protein